MDEHVVRTRMRANPEHKPGCEWRSGLLELLSDVPGYGMSMAEIGCYAGESTDVFASSGKFSRIYAVEPWLPVGSRMWREDHDGLATAERVFDEMRARHRDVIRKLRQNSVESAPRFHAGSLDLVYVDADHSYETARRDIELFLPKLAPHGVMAGHDYCPMWPGVERAVRDVFGRAPDKLYSDYSWMVRL